MVLSQGTGQRMNRQQFYALIVHDPRKRIITCCVIWESFHIHIQDWHYSFLKSRLQPLVKVWIHLGKKKSLIWEEGRMYMHLFFRAVNYSRFITLLVSSFMTFLHYTFFPGGLGSINLFCPEREREIIWRLGYHLHVGIDSLTTYT